jgi:hypothetical protein
MDRLKIECPRCKGEKGFWAVTRDGYTVKSTKKQGVWYPCITCKTQGVLKVASHAEARRIQRSVTHPKKAQTKTREKGE